MYHLNNKQAMKKFQKIGIELVKGIAIVLAAYVLMATVNPAYTGLKYILQLIKRTDNESGYLNCTKQERN